MMPPAAKLLRATCAGPDPLSRLIVELLARTGIRRGELLALTIDAVVQIGSAYWLRIPIGKRTTTATSCCAHSSKTCSTTGSPAADPPGRDESSLVEHNRTSVTIASPKPCGIWPIPPGSAPSPPTSCGTPWPPKPMCAMSLDAIAAMLTKPLP